MEFECQGVTVTKNLANCVESSNSPKFDLNSKQKITKNKTKKVVEVFRDLEGSTDVDVLSGFTGLSIVDLPPALISEIFNFLEPKELGIVSCVSKGLYSVAAELGVWKEFYCERWGLPVVESGSWKELFVEREFRSRTFLGKYNVEILYGHKEAVRTVFLLVSAKLIFTSGYDSVVRMWDMEEGLSIASSKPLGCTIRAVTADTRMLLAGGTDGFIHCWRAVEGFSNLFDLQGSRDRDTEFRLWGHEGPISCLAMDHARIYSGSWDMSVRVWDRSLLKCVKILSHSDWVWGLVPHNNTVASTSGSDVYIWDISKGTLTAVIPHAHVGNTFALARSHTGDFIFTGGEDGAIHMYEVVGEGAEVNVLEIASWMPHSGPVHSLAFEFPWLVSASSDGKMALIDVRKLLRNSRRSLVKRSSKVGHVDQSGVEPPQRMLHGFSSDLFSVDIGADRIVCGGEEGVVRIWDFTQALESERRARALKGIRLENRMRRRRLQMEMKSKEGKSDQCSVQAKKNPLNAGRSNTWNNKRGMSGKLKA